MRPVISLAATTLLVISRAATAAPDAPAPADAPVVKAEAERPQLAIGVNFPGMWKHSVGVSAAVGFAKHHAIRANVARYENTGEIGILIGDVFFDGDGSDAIKSGRNVDVGVSYMAFANRLWDGLFIEAGVLVRDKEKSVADDSAAPTVATDTMVFGARGHVGYSWLISGRVFIQAAVGASVGYEVGSETTTDWDAPSMSETSDVGRSTKSAEGFLRFGGAFDL